MRDYKSEYKNYQGKPEQIKNRASRNLARRLMKKKLGAKINGKDIDHKDGNPIQLYLKQVQKFIKIISNLSF